MVDGRPLHPLQLTEAILGFANVGGLGMQRSKSVVLQSLCHQQLVLSPRSWNWLKDLALADGFVILLLRCTRAACVRTLALHVLRLYTELSVV